MLILEAMKSSLNERRPFISSALGGRPTMPYAATVWLLLILTDTQHPAVWFAEVQNRKWVIFLPLYPVKRCPNAVSVQRVRIRNIFKCYILKYSLTLIF